MLRTLTERAIEIQKDLYLCFIDYTKAFDKLRHEEIMSVSKYQEAILDHIDCDLKSYVDKGTWKSVMKTMTDLSNQVIKKEIMPEKSKNVIISSDSYARKETGNFLEIISLSVCYPTFTVFEDAEKTESVKTLN